MAELVPLGDLPPGTMFTKPNGHVPHMVTSYGFFDLVHTNPTSDWYPTKVGGFSLNQEEGQGTPVDRRGLKFSSRFWRSPRKIPIYSFSGRRFELLKKDSLVDVLHMGPLEDLPPRSVNLWTSLAGDEYVYVDYPVVQWSRSQAWDHLVENPPEALHRKPGVSKQDNPYRAKHSPEKYTWRARILKPRLAMLLDLDA